MTVSQWACFTHGPTNSSSCNSVHPWTMSRTYLVAPVYTRLLIDNRVSYRQHTLFKLVNVGWKFSLYDDTSSYRQTPTGAQLRNQANLIYPNYSSARTTFGFESAQSSDRILLFDCAKHIPISYAVVEGTQEYLLLTWNFIQQQISSTYFKPDDLLPEQI